MHSKVIKILSFFNNFLIYGLFCWLTCSKCVQQILEILYFLFEILYVHARTIFFNFSTTIYHSRTFRIGSFCFCTCTHKHTGNNTLIQSYRTCKEYQANFLLELLIFDQNACQADYTSMSKLKDLFGMSMINR